MVLRRATPGFGLIDTAEIRQLGRNAAHLSSPDRAVFVKECAAGRAVERGEGEL